MATIEQLQSMNDTQAQTITRLNLKISRLTRKSDRLQAALQAAEHRQPTPQGIAEAIFGDDNG